MDHGADHLQRIVGSRSPFRPRPAEGFQLQPGILRDPLMLAHDTLVFLHVTERARDLIGRCGERLVRGRRVEPDVRADVHDADLVGDADRVVVGPVPVDQFLLEERVEIVFIHEPGDGEDFLLCSPAQRDICARDRGLRPVEDSRVRVFPCHRSHGGAHVFQPAGRGKRRENVPIGIRKRNVKRGCQVVEPDRIRRGMFVRTPVNLRTQFQRVLQPCEKRIERSGLRLGRGRVPLEYIVDVFLCLSHVVRIFTLVAEYRKRERGDKILPRPDRPDLVVEVDRLSPGKQQCERRSQ